MGWPRSSETCVLALQCHAIALPGRLLERLPPLAPAWPLRRPRGPVVVRVRALDALYPNRRLAKTVHTRPGAITTKQKDSVDTTKYDDSNGNRG